MKQEIWALVYSILQIDEIDEDRYKNEIEDIQDAIESLAEEIEIDYEKDFSAMIEAEIEERRHPDDCSGWDGTEANKEY